MTDTPLPIGLDLDPFEFESFELKLFDSFDFFKSMVVVGSDADGELLASLRELVTFT